MRTPWPRPARTRDKKTENVSPTCDTKSSAMEEAMNIKTSDATSASQINLGQTPEPRDLGRTSVSESSSQAASPAVDSIALSNSSDLVQQALNSVSDSRTARVNELKQ